MMQHLNEQTYCMFYVLPAAISRSLPENLVDKVGGVLLAVVPFRRFRLRNYSVEQLPSRAQFGHLFRNTRYARTATVACSADLPKSYALFHTGDDGAGIIVQYEQRGKPVHHYVALPLTGITEHQVFLRAFARTVKTHPKVNHGTQTHRNNIFPSFGAASIRMIPVHACRQADNVTKKR